MDILSALILGIIQGLTEFLPISSTGHLILAREFLGLEEAYSLSFDAVLHLATALAVLIYFWSDFIRLMFTAVRWIMQLLQRMSSKRAEIGVLEQQDRKDRTLILALILGTLPAAVLGIIFEDYIGSVFRSAEFVAWTLVAGSFIFLFAEWVAKKIPQSEITPRMGLKIGFFQALALIPGMSRSGMSISGGLLLGLKRDEAARFAFLLSLPIIVGAGGLSALRLGFSGLLSEIGSALIVGAIAAFVTGWLAIHYLLKYLKNHTLGVFVVYRLTLAALIFLVL